MNKVAKFLMEKGEWLAAATFYEALVATNVIFYLDGCDSLGRIDCELGGFYLNDLKSGKITYRKGTELMRMFWQNFDHNNGWNVALGGSQPDGTPAYNEFTRVCLEAARKMRRPSLALRIRKDMPDSYFESALDTIKTGCGLPALYNEELYLDAGKEYNSGGARYNWSVVNVGGLVNVADSLVAIKNLVYDRKKVSVPDYWQAIRKNFAGFPKLLKEIKRCPQSFFDDVNSRKAIKDLICTYFNLGGMQIQITVVDQKILKEAILHPEKYEDLIVRVGGYSEYFNRLSPELKETVLARTEYGP